MKKLVLSSLGDYTLIARVKDDGTVHEYVVAWCYNSEKDYWCQGYYFKDLSEAMFFMENRKMTKEQKRARMVLMMHEYLRNEVNDEDAYMTWINTVPDEPCSEDFEFIACDDDEWKHCNELFSNLLKELE